MVELTVNCCSLCSGTIRSFTRRRAHLPCDGGDLRHKDRVNATPRDKFLPPRGGAHVINYARTGNSTTGRRREACSRDAKLSRRRPSARRRWRRMCRRPGLTTTRSLESAAWTTSASRCPTSPRLAAGSKMSSAARRRSASGRSATRRARSCRICSRWIRVRSSPRSTCCAAGRARTSSCSSTPLRTRTRGSPATPTSAATTSRSTSRTSTSLSPTWSPGACASCSGRSP